MRNRVEAVIKDARETIGVAALSQFPLERYLEWFRSPGTEGLYNNFPGALGTWFAHISEAYGGSVLSAYHKLAMAELMRDSLDRIDETDTIAPILHETTLEWFQSVLDTLEAEPDVEFDAYHDSFKRDISISALRLIPTRGPGQLEVGWLARRFLITAGWKQFFPGLKCWLIDLQCQTKRLYSLHVDDRIVFRRFTEAGWLHMYEDIAAQMRLHPEILGLHATSWFWDPRVGEISPKMAYLYDFPRRGGAKFFRIGTDEESRKLALTNKKRLSLYEAGEYEPTNYQMIWARKKLLSFLPSSKSL